MKLNKEKHIGRVLFIVEGSHTESSILRRIFCHLLGYSYIEKRRNKPTYFTSTQDRFSQVAAINTRESNIRDISENETYMDDVFDALREQYQFPVDSSKALTWGVFENKRTGDRYLVISTHMCTRDDSVRGEQAKEALALIAVLVAEYDCPVILGGDLNGTSTSANYRLFTENGLLDVQKQVEVTSGVNTWHDYPSYDDERGMILPTAGARLGADSIDRILIANADRVSLKLFGVVVDACTLSASDHFPIFVDFSFSAGANAGG